MQKKWVTPPFLLLCLSPNLFFCFVFFFLQLFDGEGKGSLNAQSLSGLMGALLGFPQHNIDQLYAEASSEGQVTESE